MRAHAELVVGPGPVLARLTDAPPIAFRPTPEGVYLVGTAASPVGDDDVRLRVATLPRGRLTLRSSAASLAYAGGRSRWEVRASAGPASELTWRPEPLIVTSGADHVQHTILECAADAHVDWREVVLLGRHGEGPGRASLRLDVNVDGGPLLRHELRVGEGADGWDGPAVLGERRAVATRVVAGPRLLPPAVRGGAGWAWMQLEGPGWLLVATAGTAPELEAALAAAGSPGR